MSATINDFIISLHHATGIFIFWFNEHVLLDGCTVSNNFAESIAGAIYSTSYSLSIVSSTVEDNVADQDYGGILIEDADEVLIRSTNVVNNTAVGNLIVVYAQAHQEGSGGLAVLHSSSVDIDDCIFDSNAAYLYGGALYMTYSDQVSVRNSVFRANRARFGGAMNLYRNTRVELISLRLEDNAAYADGGGLHIDETVGMFVSNCTFLRNKSRKGFGSAAWIQSSSANYTASTFAGNEAPFG